MKKLILSLVFIAIFTLSSCSIFSSKSDLDTLINDYGSGNFTMNYIIQNEHVNFGQTIRYMNQDTLVQEDFNEKMTLYLTGLRQVIYDDYERDLSDKIRQLIPIISSTLLISPTWINDLFTIELSDNEQLSLDCFDNEDDIYTLDESCFNQFSEAFVYTLYHQIESFLLVMYDGDTRFKNEFNDDVTFMNRFLESVTIEVQDKNLRFEIHFNVDGYELTVILNTFDLNKTGEVENDTDISWIDHYYNMLFENGVYSKITTQLNSVLNAVTNYCQTSSCSENQILNSSDLESTLPSSFKGSLLIKVQSNDTFLVAYELYNIRYVGSLNTIDNTYILYKNHALYTQMMFSETEKIFPVLP